VDFRWLPPAPTGYELLEPLGRGGMGDVYLARELASERLVAMKFLRHPGDSELFERFLTELRVLARLDHPNIVRVLAHDFFRADPFFTMEYLPGGSLAAARAGAEPLTPAEAIRLIRPIAAAVAAAHAQGVLHRDLKMSNILLAADGTPKVADFGLAKRLDDVDPVTRTTDALGTPGYMPPEQISRKNGEIGTWSDVYGLGATLFALLTGRAPFVGPTPEEVIHQVLADAPARPRALRPGVPLGLEAIVLKCLEKDPISRYQTVGELLADLDRYESGQKPLAPSMTGWRRTKQWVRRNQRTTLLAVLLGALVAGSAFLLGTFFSSRTKPTTAEDQQELLRDQLRDGHTVRVIGDRGYPDWLKDNWLIHPATLGRSTTAGAACSFQSFHPSLLAVLNDPGLTSYRVTAELRILQGIVADAKGPARPAIALGGVGLFLGHVSGRGGDGSEAHGFLVLEFNDYLPKEMLAAGIRDGAVQPVGMLVVARPNTVPEKPRFGWGPTTRFPGTDELPAEWRVVQAEVRPSGVKFFWADHPGQEPKLLAEMSADALATNYAALQNWLNQFCPDSAITLPGWTPRAPLGVWSDCAAVAIRNVTIEPIR
jgi:serine/threonine-protein kinase